MPTHTFQTCTTATPTAEGHMAGSFDTRKHHMTTVSMTSEDDPNTRPGSNDRMKQRDVVVVVAVLAATVALDIAARSWLGRTIDGHPIALGPIVLRLHRHAASAFGFTDIGPPLALTLIAAAMAATVLELRRRGIVRSSVSTGLVVGGAVAYVVDKASDGVIMEYLEIGPLPVVGITGLAIAAGVIGELLDRWAGNEPEATARVDR